MTSRVRGLGHRLQPIRQLVNPSATRRSNTTLPTGQSALRCVTPDTDWSTSPLPVWPPLAASAAQPTQGHPANWARPPPLAGAPPKESPCGTTVQPAGCLAWAIPPRRGPRPPPARAGEVHNRPRDTAMPPSSPCLDSTCMPASRGAHCAPTPVRERRAPCPVHLAQSCLSTYSPTPSASRMVKVV